MPFMLLILGFMLVLTVWMLFSLNPRGVSPAALHGFNALLLVVALAVGTAAGMWIYGAAASMPEKRMYSWYLGISAGGAAFMILLSVGGFVRNFIVFPHSKRKDAVPPAP